MSRGPRAGDHCDRKPNSQARHRREGRHLSSRRRRADNMARGRRCNLFRLVAPRAPRSGPEAYQQCGIPSRGAAAGQFAAGLQQDIEHAFDIRLPLWSISLRSCLDDLADRSFALSSSSGNT